MGGGTLEINLEAISDSHNFIYVNGNTQRILFILRKFLENFIYSRKIPTMHKIIFPELTTTHEKTMQFNPPCIKKISQVLPDTHPPPHVILE